MPVLDGLDTAAEFRREAPETAVVMLTTFSEDEYIAAALDGGATLRRSPAGCSRCPPPTACASQPAG